MSRRIQINNAHTFAQVARVWSDQLETKIRRNGKRFSDNTIRIYRGNAQRLIQHLGPDVLPLRNSRIQSYVVAMRTEGYSASQIRSDLAVLKLVCSSVRDAEGTILYPLAPDHEFWGTPVASQDDLNTPCATRRDVENALTISEVAFTVGLAAGTGMRISEIMSLGKSVTWDSQNAKIVIFRGKTENAARTVYLDAALNDWLTVAYKPIPQSKIRWRLQKAGLPPPHSYRRFRITHCREMGMDELILKSLVGHSTGRADITDRYFKVREQFARAEVSRVSLGFNLPSIQRETFAPAQEMEFAVPQFSGVAEP